MVNQATNLKRSFRFLRKMPLLALIIAFFSIPLGAAPPQNNDQVAVTIGKTVEITYSRRKCWFPTVHQFRDGEIMVTMRMSPDEVNPEGDFSAYCISKDDGQTWSRRYTMGAGANVDGAWSQEPQSGDTIWQLYGWVDPFPAGQSQDLYVTETKFSRSGMEFVQRRDIPLHMDEPVQMAPTGLYDRQVPDGFLKQQPIAMPWGPIIKDLKGNLIAPLYYTAKSDPKYYRLALIRSTDGGKSWSQYSTIAEVKPGEKPWPGMGSEGPCEAGVCRLADKRLYCIFRTGSDGYIGNTWSSDDGRTWTPPVSTPYKGVALRVRQLSDGMLACTTGRPGPVVVMFSPDGTGKEWTDITPIFSGKSTHYTDFIEVKPGELFVVYDSIPYGWYDIPFADRKSENVIYGTFVKFHKK